MLATRSPGLAAAQQVAAPVHRRLLPSGGGSTWRQQQPGRRCFVRSQAQQQQKVAAPAGGAPTSAASAQQQQQQQFEVKEDPRTAREVALAYYSRYNNRQIDRVLELMAPDVHYEDLIYDEPFKGKAAVAKYFQKIEELVPADIKFVVEDITDGDPRRCGVRWHVEIEDESGACVTFPFSRGCSFYEVNASGQIVFARDIPEPAIKPGSAALAGLGQVAPLVRKLGPNADPAILKTLPIASNAMWLFYFSYIGYVMLSTSAPGLPVWQTPPETWAAVLHESANYFYINPALAQFGLNPVPCIAEHPVSEALFNFVNAWSLMFWPVMLADPLGYQVKNKLPLWVGTQFLTNVFFPVYLAQRLRPDPPGETSPAADQPPAQLPGYAPAFGAVAAVVGLVSVAWAVGARPEAGDLAARWEYFSTLLATSRVDWAFVVDAGLYAVWQAWLLGAAGAAPGYRFVPFFGMAAWLVSGGGGQEEERAAGQKAQ